MLTLIPNIDFKVIMGDWNAKVGYENTGSKQVVGRYGYGHKKKLLVELAAKYNPNIIKIYFQEKESRKWTWLSPGGQHKNIINLILIVKR